jgi:hypothetical protein
LLRAVVSAPISGRFGAANGHERIIAGVFRQKRGLPATRGGCDIAKNGRFRLLMRVGIVCFGSCRQQWRIIRAGAVAGLEQPHRSLLLSSRTQLCGIWRA